MLMCMETMHHWMVINKWQPPSSVCVMFVSFTAAALGPLRVVFSWYRQLYCSVISWLIHSLMQSLAHSTMSDNSSAGCWNIQIINPRHDLLEYLWPTQPPVQFLEAMMKSLTSQRSVWKNKYGKIRIRRQHQLIVSGGSLPFLTINLYFLTLPT